MVFLKEGWGMLGLRSSGYVVVGGGGVKVLCVVDLW